VVDPYDSGGAPQSTRRQGEKRVSVITLGVADVSRAQAFYEALGWQLDSGIDDESDHIAFFQTGRSVLSLWDRAKLAEDSGVTDSDGWGGVTLAYAVGSPAEVDAVLAEAKAAGARITPAAGDTSGTATPGVFVDPDGHPWEVLHNPAWSLHADGAVSLR
jgi:catechol 2,3-dioxygenase-like lactoylglutathione lyase family enzyme